MAFSVKQKLNSMRYKSFTWEYNPASCTYSCQRSYVAHKYPELAGVELEDMDTNEIVITGKGEFFGPNAYSNWMKLNAEFKTFGPGTFYHPVFTDVTQGLMTKLQAEMEPREDYVVYSFEIISGTVVHDINTPIVTTPPPGITPNGQIKVGDIVILTGYAYYDSYGSLPRSAYQNNKKFTVTRVNYAGKYPIHCGSLGWCRLEDVRLFSSDVTNLTNNTTNNTSDVVYTVKYGDTLSKICAKYGANWRLVATYNNIKNPNIIMPGQKIKIPQYMISTASKLKDNGIGIKNTTQSRSSAGGGGANHEIHVLN